MSCTSARSLNAGATILVLRSWVALSLRRSRNSLVTPFVSEEVSIKVEGMSQDTSLHDASEITKICAALIFFASSLAASVIAV